MRPNLHRVDGADKLKTFGADTKSNTSWTFLTALRDIGRASAKTWLAAHFDDIGVKGTIDLAAKLR